MKVSVWVFVDASSVIILAMMLMHEYSKAGERKKKVSSSHSRIFWCFLSVGFWVAPCRNWEFCGEVDAAVEAWSMPRESFCLLHIWDIMLLQSSFYFGKKKVLHCRHRNLFMYEQWIKYSWWVTQKESVIRSTLYTKVSSVTGSNAQPVGESSVVLKKLW